MIQIDGSHGEGGGQVLRTALGLSLVTGQPFKIERIRANRKNPGLRNQHLTCVLAAQQVGCAEVEGAELQSEGLTFSPQGVFPGNYRFSMATAGSTTLVLQTVLPALMCASESSSLILEGGTHNPWAPPFDFLEKSFLPLLRRMGPDVTLKLESAGFYPAGGGRMRVGINPSERLSAVFLEERGRIRATRGRALLSRLPDHIADRELNLLRKRLQIDGKHLTVEHVDSPGPGNALLVEIETDQLTEVFTAFGRVRLPAENVALQLVREVRAYLKSDAPVGDHLADQLLVPMSLAGGGSFVSGPLTTHATTNMDIVRMFLDVDIDIEDISKKTVRVTVRS